MTKQLFKLPKINLRGTAVTQRTGTHSWEMKTNSCKSKKNGAKVREIDPSWTNTALMEPQHEKFQPHCTLAKEMNTSLL